MWKGRSISATRFFQGWGEPSASESSASPQAYGSESPVEPGELNFKQVLQAVHHILLPDDHVALLEHRLLDGLCRLIQATSKSGGCFGQFELL